MLTNIFNFLTSNIVKKLIIFFALTSSASPMLGKEPEQQDAIELESNALLKKGEYALQYCMFLAKTSSNSHFYKNLSLDDRIFISCHEAAITGQASTVAVLYKDGFFKIHQDNQKYIAYLTMGADNGDALAQLELALNYINADYVNQDINKAKFYANLSKSQGNEMAADIVNLIDKGRASQRARELSRELFSLSEHLLRPISKPVMDGTYSDPAGEFSNSPLSSTLNGEISSGRNKICTYDGLHGESSLTISIYKHCPLRIPSDQKNTQSSTTHNSILQSELISGSNKICIYSGIDGDSTLTISIHELCPRRK